MPGFICWFLCNLKRVYSKLGIKLSGFNAILEDLSRDEIWKCLYNLKRLYQEDVNAGTTLSGFNATVEYIYPKFIKRRFWYWNGFSGLNAVIKYKIKNYVDSGTDFLVSTHSQNIITMIIIITRRIFWSHHRHLKL